MSEPNNASVNFFNVKSDEQLFNEVLNSSTTLTKEFVDYAKINPEYAHRIIFEGSANW